jgi:phage tail-like protein
LRNIFEDIILEVLADSGQRFSNSDRHDPYRNFNYRVDFVGRKAIFNSGWSYVSGVKANNEYKEYKEGGNNLVPDQIHERTIYQPISMERGMSEDTSIMDAFSGQFSRDGIGIRNRERYDVIVSVYDRDGRSLARKFTLREAWISVYETSDLSAMGTEVLFDRIVVSFKSVDFS